jgi:subtilisin family serine protease
MYAVWSGTSFATAFASGTAALVRAQHPEWPSATTPLEEIRSTLMNTLGSTGAPINALNPGFAGLLGASRISAVNAVAVGPIAPLIADVNADGNVDAADLSLILALWGTLGAATRSDIDASGEVDAADLSLLLAHW